MTPSRPPTRSRSSSPTCAASSSPKASRGCCTRSGGRATSFVPRLLGAVARAARRASAMTVRGYRVVSRPVPVRISGTDELLGEMVIQYGRRVSDTEATVARVELFLLLGVLAGSGLALLAGIAIARRAMAPIAELT